DLVGDHRHEEEDRGDGAPQDRVAAVLQQGDAVERHDQDPDPGQHVGQVPVAGRADLVAPLSAPAGAARGSASRSAPSLPTTTAATRYPTAKAPGWCPVSRVVPSTSGPWWSARP